MEPANERVRLATEELDKRLREEEVLGKTKQQWEDIKNRIDTARINSAGYKDAMDDALAVVKDIENAWAGIESKTVTLTTIQQTVAEGAASAANGTGTGFTGNPDPDSEVNPINGLTPSEQANLQAQVDRLSNSLPGLRTTLDKALAEQKAANNAPYTLAGLQAALERKEAANEAVTKAQKAYDETLSALSKARNQISPPNRAQSTPLAPRGAGPVAFSSGGKVMSYMASGGFAMGSDTVPAMLTPGEYVVKRQMVNKYGTGLLDKINSGSFLSGGFSSGSRARNVQAPRFSNISPSVSVSSSVVGPSETKTLSNSSVYNYNLSVNVASQSDPNAIAQTVMSQIRNIDSQRIRSNRF